MPPLKSQKLQASSALESVARHFDGAHREGQRFKALCPCHDDTKASLSISDGEKGKAVLKCHAGCRTEDVLTAVGLTFADLKTESTDGTRRVVATYAYRDEQKELLYEVVRYAPKDFRQRRPDGTGGWTWSLGHVRRVLYRLPELLAAPRKKSVFIVEGEKDADRLAKLGLIATTTACGANAPWLPGFSKSLKGRKVVLVPDNDEPGRERVRMIAKALRGFAKTVRILELPGLPPKGDMSDWLDGGGTKTRLLALVKKTPRQSTRHPTPDNPKSAAGCHPTTTRQVNGELSSVGLSPAPTFPVDAFPEPLQKCIHSVAEALPAPPDYFGAMMLAAMSALIGRKRCIQIKDGWNEFPVLWIVAIARSGDRKTPAFEKALEPIRDLQKKLKAEYQKELREYEQSEDDDLDEPKLVQVLTTDSTLEAMKDVLASNPNGILFAVDELAGWAKSMDQYRGGRGSDRQHWLSIWSSVQVIVNRKANGPAPIILDQPFVSVTGGIQPDALSALVNEVVEDGFAARLLLAYPDPPPPAKWNENVASIAEYHKTCNALWNLRHSDTPVRFSKRAKGLWVNWINAHREEVPPDNLRATWSKCEGHCARIALVLFLARKACKVAKSAELDVESINGAIGLIDYFKANAQRVYSRLARKSDNTRIGNALRWIEKQGGKVKARDVYRYEVAGVKDAAAATKLLEELQDLGYGEITEGRQGNSHIFSLTAKSDGDDQCD